MFTFCKARWARRKKLKENHTTKVTKIPKTKRQKYGMNETMVKNCLGLNVHKFIFWCLFVFLCSHVNVQDVQVLPTHLEQALAHHFPFIGSSLHSHCFRSRLCTFSSHVFTNPEFSICNWFFGENIGFLIEMTVILLVFLINFDS